LLIGAPLHPVWPWFTLAWQGWPFPSRPKIPLTEYDVTLVPVLETVKVTAPPSEAVPL
jgi:hypothetical protein